MEDWETALDARIAEVGIWTLEWMPGRRFVPAGAMQELTARNHYLRTDTINRAANALLAQVPLIEAQIARFSILALTDNVDHAAKYLGLVESCRATLLAINAATGGNRAD